MEPIAKPDETDKYGEDRKREHYSADQESQWNDGAGIAGKYEHNGKQKRAYKSGQEKNLAHVPQEKTVCKKREREVPGELRRAGCLRSIHKYLQNNRIICRELSHYTIV